jgi:hypothetical protein
MYYFLIAFFGPKLAFPSLPGLLCVFHFMSDPSGMLRKGKIVGYGHVGATFIVLGYSRGFTYSGQPSLEIP